MTQTGGRESKRGFNTSWPARNKFPYWHHSLFHPLSSWRRFILPVVSLGYSPALMEPWLDLLEHAGRWKSGPLTECFHGRNPWRVLFTAWMQESWNALPIKSWWNISICLPTNLTFHGLPSCIWKILTYPTNDLCLIKRLMYCPLGMNQRGPWLLSQVTGCWEVTNITSLG